MSRLLILAPIFDIPTTLSYNVAVILKNWAEEKGHDVDFLGGINANLLAMKTAMKMNPPDLISYFGHGDEKILYGEYVFSPLVRLDNAGVLRGYITSTLACLSGRELGPEVVKEGGNAYFGSAYWMYAALPENEHNYFEDWADYETVIPRMLLSGYTTGQAYDERQNLCSKYIDFYKSKEDRWEQADWYSQSTKYNMDYFRLIGNTDSKVVEGAPSLGFNWRKYALSYFLPVGLIITAAPIIYKEAKKREII